MGGKSGEVRIYKYNMSIHWGVCHGPVDEVKAIYGGEKLAWEGSITENASISIDKAGLYGGIKKEGGLVGRVDFMLGGSDQLATPALASRLGGTPTTVPGFRGILSAFFYGMGSGASGFYWAATNPYLKPLWFTVKSIPRGLGVSYAEIPREITDTDDGPFQRVSEDTDANPAHMIYECLTNPDWGMGEILDAVDTHSFLEAAATLYDERLGLSMLWAQSTTIEDFVNDILAHINGVIFTHPRTGLITLRLIRPDYDPDTLRTINPDNAVLLGFSRKAWGETTNEMKVSWTNPANEQEETVYAQDLGNISVQGAVVSDSRNFHGVRYAALAQRLCNRELRVASAPLSSSEAELDRSFWDVTPYEVLKLDWPEYGIEGLIVRVTEVSYGTRASPKIKVSLLEDVFSLPQAAFINPPGTGWIDPAQPPIPVEGARMIPAPAYSLLQDEISLDALELPSTYVALLVPSPYEGGSVSYSVDLEVPTPSGGREWVNAQDTMPFPGKGVLATVLEPEAESTIAMLADRTGAAPTIDHFLIIGPDNAPAHELEIALVYAVDALTGALSIRRGVLDTVPKAWPLGTPAWAIPAGLLDPLPSEFTVGQTVDARVITNTSLGQTDAAESPVFSATAAARPTKPLRPANVKLNGQGFGRVELSDTLELTWSHRNRLLEDVQVLSWTAPSTPVEPGVTYTVEIDRLNNAGSVIEANWRVEDVGTDTSFFLNLLSNWPPAGTAALRCRVVAIRDGERCWQNFELTGSLPVLGRGTTEGDQRTTTESDRRVVAGL